MCVCVCVGGGGGEWEEGEKGRKKGKEEGEGRKGRKKGKLGGGGRGKEGDGRKKKGRERKRRREKGEEGNQRLKSTEPMHYPKETKKWAVTIVTCRESISRPDTCTILLQRCIAMVQSVGKPTDWKAITQVLVRHGAKLGQGEGRRGQGGKMIGAICHLPNYSWRFKAMWHWTTGRNDKSPIS